MQQISILKFLPVFIDNHLLNTAINVISSQLGSNNYLLWSALNADDKLTKMSGALSLEHLLDPHTILLCCHYLSGLSPVCINRHTEPLRCAAVTVSAVLKWNSHWCPFTALRLLYIYFHTSVLYLWMSLSSLLQTSLRKDKLFWTVYN